MHFQVCIFEDLPWNLWISWWNLPDFMKFARFHEIHQISWWNLPDFMKSSRFHEICQISSWNPPDFMKFAEFHHEIRRISWNSSDFMMPNEPRTNGPIFSAVIILYNKSWFDLQNTWLFSESEDPICYSYDQNWNRNSVNISSWWPQHREKQGIWLPIFQDKENIGNFPCNFFFL